MCYSPFKRRNDIILPNLEISRNTFENIKHIDDHFTHLDKMVDIGSKTSRSIIDYKLSRFACYLIVQNSDLRKEVVALGQTYFAIQTRRMEITEREYSKLTEDEKNYQRNLTIL